MYYNDSAIIFVNFNKKGKNMPRKSRLNKFMDKYNELAYMQDISTYYIYW